MNLEIFFTDLVKWLLPIFLGFLITWLGLLIKSEWDNIKSKQPNLIKEVQLYAPILVRFLEQERKKSGIDLMSVKAMGEKALVDYLKTKGIELDLTNPIWGVIETIIEAEVNKLPKFEISADK